MLFKKLRQKCYLYFQYISGRVHGLVKEEESSTDVAVKCLKEGSSEKAMQAFHKEVALMSVLQHANVLRLLAVSTEEEPYCMIFEFMENGDLNEYLRNSKGICPISVFGNASFSLCFKK